MNKYEITEKDSELIRAEVRKLLDPISRHLNRTNDRVRLCLDFNNHQVEISGIPDNDLESITGIIESIQTSIVQILSGLKVPRLLIFEFNSFWSMMFGGVPIGRAQLKFEEEYFINYEF